MSEGLGDTITGTANEVVDMAKETVREAVDERASSAGHGHDDAGQLVTGWGPRRDGWSQCVVRPIQACRAE